MKIRVFRLDTMSDSITDAIISGLKGEFIHSDPLMILKGLTPETARIKAPGFDHSCWDLLYHTVIWNDIFLNNIKGLTQNWNPTNNWPPSDDLSVDEEYDKLVQRFMANMQEVRDLLNQASIDFDEKHKLSQSNTVELSTIKLFITILQHISYHIGQIACVRKMVDNWPPPQ